MFPVKFEIFGKTPKGETISLFNWCRDEKSGINRAWSDAKKFDLELKEVWAKPK